MSQEEVLDSEEALERLEQLEETVNKLAQFGDLDEFTSKLEGVLSEAKELEKNLKKQSSELEDRAEKVVDKWDELTESADELNVANKLLGEKIVIEGERIGGVSEQVETLEEKTNQNDSALEEHCEQIAFEKKQVADLKSELTKLFDKKDQLDAYHDGVLGKAIRKFKRISEDRYVELSEKAQEEWKLSDDGESYFKYVEETLPGSKSRLEEEQANYEEFRKSYIAEYNRMFSEIRKLAKGAVEVSLAKGYANAEESHRASLGRWSGLLVISLLGIVAAQVLPYHYSLFPDWVQNGSYLVKMLFVLPMVSPLIVLACIASKNSNIHRRFVEEYRYKKTLAATYNGLREQFSQMKDKKLADDYGNQLLEQSLKASGHNPSSLMDKSKSDIPITRILDIFEKVGASTIKLPTWFRKEITFTPHMTERPQSENVKKEIE